jgi:hypothetical protein
MALHALVDSPVRADTATELHELQGRIKRMQGTRLDTRSLPTAPELSRLLPGGALQAGGSYSVLGSTALAMSLMAGPSAAGTWCAVIGLPAFGIEAAASSGIDLERLVLVPRPGPDWLTVTAAMAASPGCSSRLPPGGSHRATRHDSPPGSVNARRHSSSSAPGRRATRRSA